MNKTIARIKFIVILVLVISVLASQNYTILAADIKFTDVSKTSGFYNDIIQACKRGFIDYRGSTNFEPDRKVTYAEYLYGLTKILDSSRTKGLEGENWYDKYLSAARELGILGSEYIGPLLLISQQDMVRLACKALGISSEVCSNNVFRDANNDYYLDIAYKEYLIEGISGYKTDGSLVMGWDNTVTRGQMAAMLMRVYNYKANPEKYKSEKAAARKAYEAKAPAFRIWNGYKIPKELAYNWVLYNDYNLSNGHDFSARFDVSQPKGFSTIQGVIASKFGKATAEQIVSYARQKTQKDQVLESKSFMLKNACKIEIQSSTDWIVSITVTKPLKSSYRWNGYVLPLGAKGLKAEPIPEIMTANGLDFFGSIRMDQPESYSMMETILAGKWGEAVTKKVMEYASIKRTGEEYLILKDFDAGNGYTISVFGDVDGFISFFVTRTTTEDISIEPIVADFELWDNYMLPRNISYKGPKLFFNKTEEYGSKEIYGLIMINDNKAFNSLATIISSRWGEITTRRIMSYMRLKLLAYDTELPNINLSAGGNYIFKIYGPIRKTPNLNNVQFEFRPLSDAAI